jgi:hypothetical protein
METDLLVRHYGCVTTAYIARRATGTTRTSPPSNVSGPVLILCEFPTPHATPVTPSAPVAMKAIALAAHLISPPYVLSISLDPQSAMGQRPRTTTCECLARLTPVSGAPPSRPGTSCSGQRASWFAKSKTTRLQAASSVKTPSSSLATPLAVVPLTSRSARSLVESFKKKALS